MYEISQLKAKNLVDLQEIAKELQIKKISQFKKLDLIYQILDTQATNLSNQPKKENKPTVNSEKQKRKRVRKPVKKESSEPVSTEQAVSKKREIKSMQQLLKKSQSKLQSQKLITISAKLRTKASTKIIDLRKTPITKINSTKINSTRTNKNNNKETNTRIPILNLMVSLKVKVC